MFPFPSLSFTLVIYASCKWLSAPQDGSLNSGDAVCFGDTAVRIKGLSGFMSEEIFLPSAVPALFLTQENVVLLHLLLITLAMISFLFSLNFTSDQFIYFGDLVFILLQVLVLSVHYLSCSKDRALLDRDLRCFWSLMIFSSFSISSWYFSCFSCSLFLMLLSLGIPTSITAASFLVCRCLVG